MEKLGLEIYDSLQEKRLQIQYSFYQEKPKIENKKDSEYGYDDEDKFDYSFSRYHQEIIRNNPYSYMLHEIDLPEDNINNIGNREEFPIIVDAYIKLAKILTKTPCNAIEITHYSGSFMVSKNQYPYMPFFEAEKGRDVGENSPIFGGQLCPVETPKGYQEYIASHNLGKKDFISPKGTNPEIRNLYFIAERQKGEGWAGWAFIIRCKSNYFNNTFAYLDDCDEKAGEIYPYTRLQQENKEEKIASGEYNEMEDYI
jgi:hypothetical protein